MTPWKTYLATTGMILCALALLVGGLDHWADAIKPSFVAGALLTIGTVLKAQFDDKPGAGK